MRKKTGWELRPRAQALAAPAMTESPKLLESGSPLQQEPGPRRAEAPAAPPGVRCAIAGQGATGSSAEEQAAARPDQGQGAKEHPLAGLRPGQAPEREHSTSGS